MEAGVCWESVFMGASSRVASFESAHARALVHAGRAFSVAQGSMASLNDHAGKVVRACAAAAPPCEWAARPLAVSARLVRLEAGAVEVGSSVGAFTMRSEGRVAPARGCERTDQVAALRMQESELCEPSRPTFHSSGLPTAAAEFGRYIS